MNNYVSSYFAASQPFVYMQLKSIAGISFSDDGMECYIDFSSSGPSVIADSTLRFIPDEHIIRISSSAAEPEYIYTLTAPADIPLAGLISGSSVTITLLKPESMLTVPPARPLCEMLSIIRDSRGCISVSSVADEFVYSARHVTRLFDNYLGYSPKAYCRMVRFHCALSEIQKNPGQSNSSFIENLNYSDQAHFQRDFKFYMGITPRQYIHMLRLSMY